ncbi:MAG: VWA domain-containing protein [Deltaproteobacteria bacterium]|jgi:hypothetical protein|nr:VWA domain-containing protein [Deltaproteobacteria bacterium]MBT4637498.1 VWA domain-containing protein [Deltaproteobacteria bacterium]MBT7153753.1 VWA domain-containing protein [Deltaproteobacteria bacterium]MBT7712199.1 VWA domain-containing protein [Deltaproteobacteria bacterium]
MQELDDLLKRLWPKVREDHYFPELPAPEIQDSGERVGLEMKGKKVVLSKAFIEQMAETLSPHLIIEGLLDHAVSHYTYCPWDFYTHLKIYKEAKSVLEDKTLARKAADCFMDVVADTHCVRQKKTPLPDIYRNTRKGRLNEVMCALYQKIWGVDLGVDTFEDAAARLARIPYLDRGRWPESMRRFALVFENLNLEEDHQQKDPEKDDEKRDRMDNHSMDQYSDQQIEDGLQKLARESETPMEFKAILEDIEEEIPSSLKKKGKQMGFGKGVGLDGDVLYYMKLAQNYALPIQKRPLERSGSLYPHNHIPWEVGQPFHDIDPFKSFGKLMPGLTKSWRRIEGEMYGHEPGTPNCMVIIDSSASMVEPGKEVSHAVLGAACAVDAYLRKGASVAVYNFSDADAGDELILHYSRDKKKIYHGLCRYFGGGTHLHLERIRGFQSKRLPDIFMITDMQITNLENLVQYFNECENRITVVAIGQNLESRTFQRTMALQQNVQIYRVENREDIPKIILGKVRDYLSFPGNSL